MNYKSLIFINHFKKNNLGPIIYTMSRIIIVEVIEVDYIKSRKKFHLSCNL